MSVTSIFHGKQFPVPSMGIEKECTELSLAAEDR